MVVKEIRLQHKQFISNSFPIFYRNLKNRIHSGAIFTDYSIVFETLLPNIFIKILHRNGIKGEIAKLIKFIIK